MLTGSEVYGPISVVSSNPLPLLFPFSIPIGSSMSKAAAAAAAAATVEGVKRSERQS